MSARNRAPAWSAAAAALALLAAPVPASSQPAPLVLEGHVAHPARLSVADLTRLAPTTITVSFATEHGPEHDTYTGALLWAVLDHAGLQDAPGHRTRLLHTIVAVGQDGYAIALALGEIDPGFEGKPVLLAYARNGKPLQMVRLVVPGDRRGGRSVRDLVSLQVN